MSLATAAASLLYTAGVHAATNRDTRARVEREEAERERLLDAEKRERHRQVEQERTEREKSIDRAVALLKEQFGKDLGFVTGQLSNFNTRAERGSVSLEGHILKLGGVEGRTVRLEQRIDVDISPRVHDFANKAAVFESDMRKCEEEIRLLRERKN